MIDQMGTGQQHHRSSSRLRRQEKVDSSTRPKTDVRSTDAGKSKNFDKKERHLSELQQQQNATDAQIRSLQKIGRELEQAHESFRTFYTKSPIGYVTLSQTGEILDANPAAAALFGVRLSREPFSALIHHADVHRFLAHLTRCRESNAQRVITELRLRTPVADPAHVQIITVPSAQPGEPLLTAIVDITDRIRNSRELAEAKEFSESIVETVSQPLAVLDRDLQIVSVNRAFVEFFKQPAEYAHGRVFEVMLNLWWSGNALRSALEKVLARDQPLEQLQVDTELPEVGKRTLLFNARRLYRKQGSPPLLLVAMEDITARSQAEEKMRQLNQELETRVAARTEALKKSNEQMEAFCYSIAHDLRAPLRSMTGFSGILLNDHARQLDERARDYIGRINQSAERMDRLIRDLLSYGRLNTAGLEIQDVNLDETFRTILSHNVEEIKSKRATITKTGTLPRVRGHPVVLQTIFTNLLFNAMKFVAPGVEPVISVNNEDRGTLARIWVTDNGIGIAPQNRGKIFGVFERLHSPESYPGTGIGLAIVHKGIERMGGRVGVESELGKGSRFWIELPKSAGTP
ncbi:MAG TPA: ATP-binding protein [Verrucomicrobiae bacterium]|jgi:PAS domain S-box-containing protein